MFSHSFLQITRFKMRIDRGGIQARVPQEPLNLQYIARTVLQQYRGRRMAQRMQ
jgi:hypothetical protein